MKKQNKKKRKAFGCALLMAALLSVSLGALAQEGLFQRGTPIEHYGNDGSQGLLGRSAAGNPEGNFFHQSFGIDDEGNFVHQTFGVDDEGNFVHQTFGSDAPLGSG